MQALKICGCLYQGQARGTEFNDGNIFIGSPLRTYIPYASLHAQPGSSEGNDSLAAYAVLQHKELATIDMD